MYFIIDIEYIIQHLKIFNHTQNILYIQIWI